MKICFLTKIEKPGVKEAIRIAKTVTKEIDIFYGTPNDPFPPKAKHKSYQGIRKKF